MLTSRPGHVTRRELLLFAGAQALHAAFPSRFVAQINEGLEALYRPAEGGGYAWESESEPHTTPTFAAVGIHRVLGTAAMPHRDELVKFLHKYPVPERRRTERPLWTFDWQQVQALQWLGADTSSFRQLASGWNEPTKYEARYEAGANPVLQFQSAAVRTRKLLGIDTPQPAWRKYFEVRRRPNGTYNNTPAAEGSDGHLLNTLWGVLAAEALGETMPAAPTRLAQWVMRCQRPSGGFTWSPDAQQGAVEDAGYTWAAVSLLRKLGGEPADKRKLVTWLESLRDGDGLWRETADGRSNPLGTWYVLETFAMLGHSPSALLRGPAVVRRPSISEENRVWTMQIEAPGKGSPEEAVTVADTAGVHIWAAKNSEPGWIDAAQAVAARRKVNVQFAVGNEEYNTFVTVPGMGTYSHLADLCAPAKGKIGDPLSTKIPHAWERFRDRRIPALKAGGGRMVWQFNENEELTRILLDEAVEKRTYAGIATFHFGNENFLHSQPYLHRWYGRLPFVALADAHHAEAWWSYEQTAGFRTLFIAKEPTWEGWLHALDRDWVMGVRRDAVTNFVLREAGGLPDVRDFVRNHQSDWQWWSDASPWPKRPMASLVVLTPESKFEAGAPKDGRALRVRLAATHTPQGQPREPLVELVSLTVNGKPVQPEPVETKGPQGAVTDRYLLAKLEPSGPVAASAQIRVKATGEVRTVTL